MVAVCEELQESERLRNLRQRFTSQEVFATGEYDFRVQTEL